MYNCVAQRDTLARGKRIARPNLGRRIWPCLTSISTNLEPIGRQDIPLFAVHVV